jgi:hypothetical protein
MHDVGWDGGEGASRSLGFGVLASGSEFVVPVRGLEFGVWALGLGLGSRFWFGFRVRGWTEENQALGSCEAEGTSAGNLQPSSCGLVSLLIDFLQGLRGWGLGVGVWGLGVRSRTRGGERISLLVSRVCCTPGAHVCVRADRGREREEGGWEDGREGQREREGEGRERAHDGQKGKRRGRGEPVSNAVFGVEYL